MNPKLNRPILIAIGVVLVTLGMGLLAWPGASRGAGTDVRIEDTSFAIEYSYACLSGGCHETNTKLMSDTAESPMAHAMVKCNACHGTHTAADVGREKPNLTGYRSGIGATGYKVPTARCLVCHNHIPDWMRNQPSCIDCHDKHIFDK